jgi:hypothetical protein
VTEEAKNDMAAFMSDYERRRAQLAQASATNRAAVMEKLKALGVSSVTVNYDGMGDSGQIEDVTFYSSSDPVEIMAGADIRQTRVSWLDHHTYRWPQPEPTVSDKPLDEALEHLCYNYLEVHHDGWENNDGAEGEFAFDVAEGTVTLTHRERVTEFDTTETEL